MSLYGNWHSRRFHVFHFPAAVRVLTVKPVDSGVVSPERPTIWDPQTNKSNTEPGFPRGVLNIRLPSGYLT